MPSHRNRKGFTLVELLVVVLIIGILVALLLPARRSARPAARRTQCRSNLHQIGIALHNYADVWGGLPPACTVDAEGRPLHSWRTLILPYLDQGPLYDTIDLSKPWDHPDNAAARETRLEVYRCPSAAMPDNHTTYVGVVGATGCFHPTDSRAFLEITDPSSGTLMVVEVFEENAVPWMSPRDTDGGWVLRFSDDTPLPHEGGMQATFADGSSQFLSTGMSDGERRAMLTIAESDGAE